MQDLIAGRIDYMCDSPSTSRPRIETNNVKAIATTGAKRTSVLPVVPTASEQSLDFEVMTWQGLFLPKDTPDPIVRHLNQAVSAALDLPFVRERFKAVGEDVAPAERRSPEYFAKFVAAEIDKWSGPIKASPLPPRRQISIACGTSGDFGPWRFSAAGRHSASVDCRHRRPKSAQSTNAAAQGCLQCLAVISGAPLCKQTFWATPNLRPSY
jgi:tripartite tricarboxylate transporter family receptor